jgi:hypothetical protein
MANCDDLFQTFDENISVSSARKKKLRKSRNAIRDRIRKHFKEVLKVAVPKFHGQGSYSMDTLENPLEGCDYDIDDGVYLQHLGDDPAKWPTAATVHQWIVDATTGYTDQDPQDRPRCVRVIYKGDPPYHVDLPCYVMSASDVPLLFDKSREKASSGLVSPYESDPRAMTDWFVDRVDEDDQVRRIVRYSKAWKDYQRDSGAGVAKGLALTILMTETVVSDARDDIAFVKTVSAAYTRLSTNISIKKPLTPFEDLTAAWTTKQREDFLDRLKQLRDRGNDALDEESKEKAAKIWQKVLGDRFPDAEPEDDKKKEKALRTSAPAIIGSDGRSA